MSASLQEGKKKRVHYFFLALLLLSVYLRVERESAERGAELESGGSRTGSEPPVVFFFSALSSLFVGISFYTSFVHSLIAVRVTYSDTFQPKVSYRLKQYFIQDIKCCCCCCCGLAILAQCHALSVRSFVRPSVGLFVISLDRNLFF